MDDEEPLAPEETPRALQLKQRNAFLESLSPAAQSRFIETLEESAKRGLDEDTAWREAVIAAETTYPGRQSNH